MLTALLKRITATFSTQAKLKASVEDWEYAKQINEALKAKKVNEAFNTLVRSYLNNQVLDIQTYHSIYCSLKQSNLPISYMEVLYKLYRQHFQPNILLLELIKSLKTDKDSQLKANLKKDLKQLSLQYPINQHQPFQSKEKNKKQTQEKIQIIGNFGTPKIQISPITLQSTQNRKLSIKQLNKDNSSNMHILSEDPKIKQITQNQLQQFFSSILQSNGKIIIHDLEIFYQQDEIDSSDYEQNEEYDDSQKIDLTEKEGTNQEQNNYAQYFAISKIKIGKIQIYKNDK